MSESVSEHRLQRWERISAYPLTVLSVIFIVVYAVPILVPGLAAPWKWGCEVLNIGIWVLFGFEFLARLALAGKRGRFLRTHWFDLLVLILPIVRPLRALRLITALSLLNRRAEAWTRGRLAVYVGGTTVLLVGVAALAVLDAERGRVDSNIQTYPQALWWGLVTITTVGYGDFFPTTVEGRLVALTMMLAGIGLIGFVTGSLASWIVERIATGERSEDETGGTALLLREVRELRSEVAGLRAELADRQDTPAGTDGGPAGDAHGSDHRFDSAG